jgi:hypothetical protein
MKRMACNNSRWKAANQSKERKKNSRQKFFRRVPCHTFRDEIINQTIGNELETLNIG